MPHGLQVQLRLQQEGATRQHALMQLRRALQNAAYGVTAGLLLAWHSNVLGWKAKCEQEHLAMQLVATAQSDAHASRYQLALRTLTQVTEQPTMPMVAGALLRWLTGVGRVQRSALYIQEEQIEGLRAEAPSDSIPTTRKAPIRPLSPPRCIAGAAASARCQPCRHDRRTARAASAAVTADDGAARAC